MEKDKSFTRREKQKKYCYLYQKGACEYGDVCKYIHENEPSLKIKKKSKMCFSFQKGNCRWGDECKFEHTTVEGDLTKEVVELEIYSVEGNASNLGNVFSFSHRVDDVDSMLTKDTTDSSAIMEERPTEQQEECFSLEHTFPKVAARPQVDVPGFEGMLTCCSDWPPTKKGGPPGAQSAIFNPLLACVLGELPPYCSKAQVEYALEWWSAVFPALPRWVKELRDAGLTVDCAGGQKLIGSITTPKKNKSHIQTTDKAQLAKRTSSTNNLIFKHSKDIYGEVPHFKGKAQNAALELSPMVAVEIYACVTCMYATN